MIDSYVDVAVFAPLHGRFTYSWPSQLGEPEKGLRVRIPFGRGFRQGVVLQTGSEPPGFASKPIDDRLEMTPSCSPQYLEWLERGRRYYLAAEGELLETALAWASADEGRKLRLLDADLLSTFGPELSSLFPTKRAVTVKTLRSRSKTSALVWRLHRAARAGALAWIDEAVEPAPAEVCDANVELNRAQRLAVDAIRSRFDSFAPILLFGATGSGKTEVYLDVAADLIRQGRQVLILVPEIGLTPMWLNRLQSRFSHIGIWHSAMAASERLAVQQQLNGLQVLIGTRSALFLPLPNLAMIVVDEEHDTSFKQQEGVNYSARDMALLLAQQAGVPVVLGSATPSLESWRQVKEGSMTLLELPERVAAHQELTIDKVDMRGHDELLSPQLIKALKETKEEGQQSILFLNRRGYAPALQCTACGDVPQCPSCSLNLTLHRRAGQLRCHACGMVRRVPAVCEVCGEAALMPLGAGTEKLEELLHETLPELNFARFDRDAIQSHSRLKQTLAAFELGDLDCLIGTQMLVKGHDFPNVTLVGVVNADMGLSLPDFRASERWWQQLTQVTGRAGRGEAPGRVIIQSRSPDAPWFSRIGDVYAREVLDEELELRRQLNYPPFSRWVRIIFSAPHLNRAEQAAAALAERLERWDQVLFSGPMLCPLERLAGRYRVELLLRDEGRRLLPWKLAPLLEQLPVPSGVRRKVDVDPLEMM